MKQQATRRNTWLFIGFLLLGGIMHFFDPTENLFLNSFLFSLMSLKKQKLFLLLLLFH